MRTGDVHRRLALFGPILVACVIVFNTSPTHAQENGTPAGNGQKWNYDEIKKAPEKARLRQNLFQNDANSIRAGGKLFQRNCAECHGMKAEGGKRAPSLLRDEVQQATPGALFWVLSNGVVWHGMPDWSKLPEPERWQIVTFLKALKTAGTAEGPGGS